MLLADVWLATREVERWFEAYCHRGEGGRDCIPASIDDVAWKSFSRD
jgi:hypothetical protein